MENFALNHFDVHYQNPFREDGESFNKFKARCNRSMAWVKNAYMLRFGQCKKWKKSPNNGHVPHQPRDGKTHAKIQR